MYIKKILWAIAIIGIVIAAFFAYYVYGAMFKSNTAFNNDECLYFYSNRMQLILRCVQQLEPLLIDIEKFDALAERKQYNTIRKSRAL